jgi:hypothetical protein
MTPEHATRPPPIADRPLFRPEAEQFRQQRHLGTIILFRPVAVRLLTLVPLAISALLVLVAAPLTVRPRFAGLADAPAGGDHVTLTVDAGAAGAIQPRDRVTVEITEPVTTVPGTVISRNVVDCRTQTQAALLFGTQPRRCLALELALDAPLPQRRTSPLVQVRAATRSYLSYLLGG